MVILFIISCNAPNDAVKEPQEQENDEAEQRVREKIDATLDNPAASPEELVDTLAAAQQLPGFDAEEEELKRRLDEALMKELLDPLTCKQRAGEILVVVQQLRSDLPHEAELKDLAEAKTRLGADVCGKAPEGQQSSAELTLTGSWNEGPGTNVISRQHHTIKITGILQEHTLFGRRAEGYKEYAFTSGTLTWNIDDWVMESCAEAIRRGSGTETLNGVMDGTIQVLDDGTYSGTISKRVMIPVSRVPTDQTCEVEAVASEEEETVELYLEGTVENLLVDPNDGTVILVGTRDDSREPDQENGIVSFSSVTTWELRLPK